MVRKIIRIDEGRCNGCGACAAACREGAIAMVGGKARLTREDYCDGLGACLPICPAGAIAFEEREAAAYDPGDKRGGTEKANADGRPGGMLKLRPAAEPTPGGMLKLRPAAEPTPGGMLKLRPAEPSPEDDADPGDGPSSQLRQWPVQIKLAPANAPFLADAHLLVAADCAAYAYANFHQDFIRGRATLIGCPKLDGTDYAENLESILRENTIRSLDIVRMEVPCCGGLEHAAEEALRRSGKFIPWRVHTVSVTGRILKG